jgi:hypothetical protein
VEYVGPRARTYASNIVANDILKTAEVSFKANMNNKIILVGTWSPVYTPLYCISHDVFICFMSSLICVHAATDSDSSSMCMITLCLEMDIVT